MRKLITMSKIMFGISVIVLSVITVLHVITPTFSNVYQGRVNKVEYITQPPVTLLVIHWEDGQITMLENVNLEIKEGIRGMLIKRKIPYFRYVYLFVEQL